MTPWGQDDHEPLLFQADAHQNPMCINMHFLLDSKCFSAETTENFQIAYDKVWISNELIFSLLNYGNNSPKHSHHSSSLIPYKKKPVAGSLIRLLGWSLGPEVSQVFIPCIGSAKQLPITLDDGGTYLIYLAGTNCWPHQQQSQIHSYLPRSFSSSRDMVVVVCFF